MITRKPEQLFQDQEDSAGGTPTSDGRESYDDRLSRILRAATTVIAREGYQRASMRVVAKAADVSLAGLYHYFASKEQMLFLIQFRTFSSLLGNVREKLHGVRAPQEQLRVMIRAHIAYFASNIAALKVCSHELDMLTGDAYRQTRAIRREYYTLTREIIETVLKEGPTACPYDAHVATMSLFGTLNWLYRWYEPKKGPSPTALAKQIADQVLMGLLNQQGPANAEQ